MIVLKLLLPKNLFNVLAKNVNHELDSLRTNLVILTEQEILDAMGFPTDWRKKLLSI